MSVCVKTKPIELRNWALDGCEWASRLSKDPSTKVGAMILRPDKSIASMGRNGFPPGIRDTFERLADRELKYPLTIHAEDNAIGFAREPLIGYTLWCTHRPCIPCCMRIIRAGIISVQFEHVVPGWDDGTPYLDEAKIVWMQHMRLS